MIEERDMPLLEALSAPLPLEPEPFARIAEQAGRTEEEVLEKLRGWTESGMIRRFGARVRHRRLGARANGMSVWRVPAGGEARAAACMIQRDEVSHCYQRPAQPGWPYTLYAMIHGATREDVLGVAETLARETGLQEYEVLFSVREFTKRAPRLFGSATQNTENHEAF